MLGLIGGCCLLALPTRPPRMDVAVPIPPVQFVPRPNSQLPSAVVAPYQPLGPARSSRGSVWLLYLALLIILHATGIASAS
jgi:hypothetical protein